LPRSASCRARWRDLAAASIEQRARGLQVGRHVGEHELGVLEIGDRLAELLAILGIGHRLVEAALRAAQRAGADVEPPAIEPGHGEAEAVALAPTRLATGTRQSSKITCAVGLAFQPSLRSRRAEADRPGVSFSTTRQLMPFDLSSPVRTMTDIDVVIAAPEMNCLVPLST
jgi:hypothetical protein